MYDDEEIKKVLQKKVEDEWPDDFQMQMHVLKEQLQALEDLRQGRPADISEQDFKTVRDKAAADWPDDFVMRLHVEKEQFDALRELGRAIVPEPGAQTAGTSGSQGSGIGMPILLGCGAVTLLGCAGAGGLFLLGMISSP